MITTNTWYENNNTKYCVKFDCRPKDVWYGNYKHTAGGTTARLGIWEGVKLTSLKYKDDDGIWRNRDVNSPVINIYSTRNGATMEVEGTYEIWTMGFPGRSYPFFYYGNFSGVRSKYQKGYFSDYAPKNPDNLKDYYAKVPWDWNLTYTGWAHRGGHSVNDCWSYKHAMQAGGETWNQGCYEYRNGTNSGGQNGWTSESGRYPQESRRNCFWIFEKKFRASVTSHGVVMNPDVPSLYVIPSKGDNGKVRVTHTSKTGGGAYIKLCAWNTRTGTLSNVVDFDSWIENNQSKEYYVDFTKHCGGEFGRGSDIKYYAWAKNAQGYYSNNQLDPNHIASAYWKGVHRYNGRPSIPTGYRVVGRDNVYYDDLTFSWNKSYDPDGDGITYQIWMKVIAPNGDKLLDKLYATDINGLSFNFNISQYPENSRIMSRVKSFDGQIDSGEWSNLVDIYKGQGAKAADSIYPINGSTIYNKRPRILIGTGDYPGSENNLIKVKWNNTWYNNKTNSNLFSNMPGNSKTIVFKAPTDSIIGQVTFSVKMNNVYADSPERTITYNCAETKYSTGDIDPYNIIRKDHIDSLREAVNNTRKAYGLKPIVFDEIIIKQSKVALKDYTDLAKGVSDVNTFINNYDANSKLDYNININTDLLYIKDDEWDELINVIRNI